MGLRWRRARVTDISHMEAHRGPPHVQNAILPAFPRKLSSPSTKRSIQSRSIQVGSSLLSLFSQFARTTKSSIIYDLAFLLASLMMARMLSRTDFGRLDRASKIWAMSGRDSHRDAPGPAPLKSAFTQTPTASGDTASGRRSCKPLSIRARYCQSRRRCASLLRGLNGCRFVRNLTACGGRVNLHAMSSA